MKAYSDNGIIRKLIYNESLILVDKFDMVEFEIPCMEPPEVFIFLFRFDDTGEKLTSTINQHPEYANIFDLTLHKWYSSAFVENKNPYIIKRENGKSLLINWRTSCQEKLSQRTFHLTVWES